MTNTVCTLARCTGFRTSAFSTQITQQFVSMCADMVRHLRGDVRRGSDEQAVANLIEGQVGDAGLSEWEQERG